MFNKKSTFSTLSTISTSSNNSIIKPLSLIEVWRRFCFFATELLGNLRNETASETENDDDLAVRMSKGDDQAFSQLYERYFQKIYTFVIRRVIHQHTAEDIVSEVFLKAFAKRQTFVLRPSFSAWLYRIATNTITDHYRMKHQASSLDDEEKSFDPADSRQNVIESTDQNILGEELERVLENLPERERLVITMKYYAEASYEEIAQTLKCTPNNAGVILHRALSKCEKLASDKLMSFK
ncbi:MAG: RNA polymerase sigma factor [Candidatus Uhrbacteria bacterium]